MDKKSFRPRFQNGLTLFVFCLLLSAPIRAQLPGNSERPLADLITELKRTNQLPCGQRDEAVRIAKEIIQRFATDRESSNAVSPVIEWLRVAEQQEQKCKGGSSEDSLDTIFESYKAARKAPCGQREEAVRIGKRIIQVYGNDEYNQAVIDWVKKDIQKIEEEDKECKDAVSLENLFEEYKKARKLPCGERSPAIRTGKQILELYGSDEQNQSVIVYVEKDTAKIEAQDRICIRNTTYNRNYKTKNWRGFFASSKEIITEEGDKPLALDVMLTLVSVGYRRTAYERDNFYNGDTLFYAKKAIDLIEAGVKTQSRWGVFEPYEKMDNALAWLSYVIGYITYFRLKENKKAIPYFYKATQYTSEFKYDAFVYQAVAIHYFDKESVLASSLTINDFINKASSLGQFNEPDASPADAAKNNEIATLYKQLVNLYNLRYNLAPEENVNDLGDYIQKLINRPLLDTARTNSKTSTQAKY